MLDTQAARVIRLKGSPNDNTTTPTKVILTPQGSRKVKCQPLMLKREKVVVLIFRSLFVQSDEDKMKESASFEWIIAIVVVRVATFRGTTLS